MKRHAPKTRLSSEPTMNCLNSLRNRDRLCGSSDLSDLGRARGRLEVQRRGRRSDDQSLDSRNRFDNVQEGQDQIHFFKHHNKFNHSCPDYN
jgi:hypothetical protein